MNILIWTVLAFISGSLPFSVWLGRLALRTDIRQYGDHNPGASNVVRAGGFFWGILALILDIAKGAVPVSLAWFWGGLSDWALVPVGLAPIVGHAYSPFLRFRGGKAVAVSLGTWGGLLIGEGPIVLVTLLLVWYTIVTVDGWAVLLTVLSFLVYLLLTDKDSFLLVLWAGNALLLTWKYHFDLEHVPHFRPWLRKLLPLEPVRTGRKDR